VPYQGYADGLYLVTQRSREKGVDHFAIIDIGNSFSLPEADGVNAVVVHLCRSGVVVEPLRHTGTWRVLEKITDEASAVERYHDAVADPYKLFANNCEHFARFIASGVRESKQVKAVYFFTGLAVMAVAAATMQQGRR